MKIKDDRVFSGVLPETTFYWSDELLEDSAWRETGGVMTMMLLPKKWWSIKEWKFCKDWAKHYELIAMVKK